MNQEEMLMRLRSGEDPLILSIEKWNDIIFKGGKDLLMNNCALCYCYIALFFCKGCPIAERKKKEGKTSDYCIDTPHEEWINHQEKEHYDKVNPRLSCEINCKECERLAKKQLQFLESLIDIEPKGYKLEPVDPPPKPEPSPIRLIKEGGWRKLKRKEK